MNAKEKTTAPIMKKIEEQRFEFVLYINNNIICQRYFHIFDFNEDSINSLDIKEMVDEIAGMNKGEFGTLGIIPNYLKRKSMQYLWENYNPYFVQTDESYRAPAKKGDEFQFEFKVDKRVVVSAQFSNEFFTLNPRVSVDIREVIPEIMSEIRQTTSRNKYSMVTV
jgi:hypothetical protein